MRFLSPEWLFLLPILIPLFSIIFIRLVSKEKKYVKEFSEFVHIKFSKFTLILMNIAVASLIFSLAKPQIAGTRKVYKSTEIVFLADVSLSTRAKDKNLPANKNRMDIMKDELINAVLQSKDETIGLVVFAGRAFPLIPPTTDRNLILSYFNMLHPEIISERGTNIKHALDVGLDMLKQSDEKNRKVLVLLSDGGEEARKVPNYDEIFLTAAEIGKAGISLYVLGIGGEKKVKIPDYAAGEDQYYRNYVAGTEQFLETRLDVATLRKIAQEGGGAYQTYEYPGQLSEMLDQEKVRKVLDHVEKDYRDANWMLLLLAFGCLLLAGSQKRSTYQ